MTKVVVRNGNVDGALRTFKQKNAKDGSLKSIRERQEGYMKPGVKKRIAKKKQLRIHIKEKETTTRSLKASLFLRRIYER